MGRASPFVHSSAGGRASPMVFTTLTASDIVDTLAISSDGGQTLDFSHRNLVDVGEVGAEELAKVGREEDLTEESPLQRIALAGNRLATLPMAFSLLSHLRYLNLRSNSFSVFPEVLTIMPSLEVLDFGRNKIKRFPSNPGSLVNLRVLSLTRNKIQRLPSYLVNFRNLVVLRVDHNPIEWPPKAVMEPQEKLVDPEAMHQWVASLRTFMEERSPPADYPLAKERRPSDESLLQSEASETDLTSSIDDSSVFWAPPLGRDRFGDDGVTPHARSFSIGSETSVYSTSSSVVSQAKPEKPTPLCLDSLSTLSSDTYDSPTSFLPTPEGSFTSADESGGGSVRNRQHGRNASVAVAGSTSTHNGPLTNKKSMPDLRTAKVHFTTEKRVSPRKPQGYVSDDPYTPLSALPYKHSPSSAALPEVQPLRIRSNSRPTHVPNGHSSPADVDKVVPSMDYERNSYFRRMSAQPVSSTIPQQLLGFVDAVRGILFAVSQVYQSLHHYTVYAIDDRLSSVLLKVLVPASTYMSRLIDYLDRFDAMSRRGFPSPAVCRSVVECCRDNVAVFGKALSVLALQLKVLATRDDARYTRQMLLVFYGATAEISNAWQNMVPHLETVEPFLQDSKPTPLSVKSHLRSQASLSRVLIPPIAEQPEPPPASAPALAAPTLPNASVPFARAMTVQPPLSASSLEGRTRMSRRHAGSFSAKDLQIGRSMVNAELLTPVSAMPNLSHSPTPSRQVQRSPSSAVIPPLPSSSIALQAPTSLPLASAPPIAHFRHDSQTSFTPSPTSSAGVSLKNSALEIPSSSNTLVDRPAIHAMDHAVKAAPAVWAMMAEMLDDMPDSAEDLREKLERAQKVTNKLRKNIATVQEGHNTDRKSLREDAHAFVKIVITLSNVVKTYDSSHRLSMQLRKDIAELTSATQEFVMLLHVSSFSSPSTPRSHSPFLNGNGQQQLPSVMNQGNTDAQPRANLARSRSVQQSTPNPDQMLKEVPKSALPHQAFKVVPPVSRSGMKV